MRDRLLAANETVDWYPPHIKHGRFGKWLEDNVDWAISRERYWGTPLPVWRCENGHAECLGSFAEVEERSGRELPDPHRPYVDEHTWPCTECGEEMRREPVVIDVWFDSGSMPFAQRHAPFENEARFEETFPADYICEAHRPDARLVLLADRDLDAALRRGAVPHRALPRPHRRSRRARRCRSRWATSSCPGRSSTSHGADAFRWYYLTSKQPWDGYLFSTETVGESVRQFLLQLWNTYGFYVLYANVNDVRETAGPPRRSSTAGRSRASSATIAEVRDRMEDYDATRAGQAIAAFSDELSNWYVRRSRRRFWDGEPAAFGTLRDVPGRADQAARPVLPVHRRRDLREPRRVASRASTSATSPRPIPRSSTSSSRRRWRSRARRCGSGLAARGHGKLKVRQPLRAAVVVAAGEERAAIERMRSIVLDELNVKELRFVSEAGELGSYEVKPNYRALGPRFGKQMPQVAAAIEALEPAHVAGALRAGHRVGDRRRRPRPRARVRRPVAGHAAARRLPARARGLARRGAGARARRRARREGLAREIVHAVQNARKAAGLEVEDRIALTLGGDDELLGAARAHEGYVTGETLATSIAYDSSADGAEATIEGRLLQVAVARA